MPGTPTKSGPVTPVDRSPLLRPILQIAKLKQAEGCLNLVHLSVDAGTDDGHLVGNSEVL